MKLNKQFYYGAATMYLAWALLSGLTMKSAIPNLNALGVVYIGLTAPIPLTCGALNVRCSVVPPVKYAKWLFSFDRKTAGRNALKEAE